MKKVNGVDAILFDLMGVLLFTKSDYRPDPLIDGIDNAIGGVIDDEVFKQEALNKFHLSESDFDEVLTKIVDKYEPFQKLWELLPELRKYYKLAIINNGTALTLPQFNQKLNFNKYFDLFISSAEEGLQKPDAEIYINTAKRLGVALERCLFMDDSKVNIEGAKKVGMQTLLWPNKETGYEKFIKLIGV